MKKYQIIYADLRGAIRIQVARVRLQSSITL